MRNLPDEIIFDIVSRVSAKSVGLWRCVSKSWRTILSHPNFIKTHLQMSKINSLESLLFFGLTPRGFAFYSAPLNNAEDIISLSLTKSSFEGNVQSTKYIVYGSCDGLVLVGGNYHSMAVMNPVTREIKYVGLSLEASGCSLYGFGYDSVRDDYKIVFGSAMLTMKKRHHTVTGIFVDVYSLKTDSWKRLTNLHYRCAGLSKHLNAFVCGCIHHIAYRTKGMKLAIVAFNLVDEKFREVPPPSLISDYLIDRYTLVVLGGYLCMYDRYENCEVWVMKEYGVLESWTKITMNIPHGSCECFLGNQEQVVVNVYEPRLGLVMWNVKQGTLKKIVLNGYDDLQYSTPRVDDSFVESLVSPHSETKSKKK